MDMECAAYNLNETRSNRMKIYVLNITDFDRREIQHHLDRHRHSVPRKKSKYKDLRGFIAFFVYPTPETQCNGEKMQHMREETYGN